MKLNGELMKASRTARMVTVAALAATLMVGCTASDGEGETQPEGASVTIKRDSFGTPRIYADDTYSLFYGLGYAVAEDRLFQWEMIKRMARGTAAEVYGASHVDADTAARRAYDPVAIQEQIDALPATEKDILQGWVDGYNLHVDEVLADPETRLSAQFAELDLLPTHVSTVDLVAAYIRGSLANFGDSNAEVLNLGLLDALKQQHGDSVGAEIFDQVRWKNDPTAPTTLGDEEQPKNAQGDDAEAAPADASEAIFAHVPAAAVRDMIDQETLAFGGSGPDFYPTASNTWLLGPERIAEGQAAFHIGPQFGNNSPTNAYGFGLHGAGYNTIGTSHWGFPMVMWGANDDIGWGVTVGGGDTVDIFQLELNPDDPLQYSHNGEWKDLDKRVETIKVEGEDDVTVEFLTSHYGQIDLVDAENNIAYARARTWTGREVDTLVAWSQMNTASDWDEYLEYAERISASMNWYYIDAEDNIGVVYVGAFVERDPGFDFRLPLPGDGSADWLGPLDFDEHPRVLNPDSGEIANWNNKISRDWDNADYRFWGQSDRVDVIRNALESESPITLEEFRRLNEEVSLTEPNFTYFKPFLVEAVADLPDGDPRKDAVAHLADWDGTYAPSADGETYDTPANAIFYDWLPRMVEATLADDIPAEFWSQYQNVATGTVTLGVTVTHNALLGEEAGVPQNYDFFNGDEKYDVIRSTLQATVDEMSSRYGEDPATWLLPLQPHAYSIQSLGTFDVNSAGQERALPINMNRGTSNHMVTFGPDGLDYADVIAPGQSGFIAPDGTLSPNYEDQLEMYGAFDLKSASLNEPDESTFITSVSLPTQR